MADYRRTLTDFQSVGVFHGKFNLPRTKRGKAPRKLTAHELEFRLNFILEEFQELCEACGSSLEGHGSGAVGVIVPGALETFPEPSNHVPPQDLPKIADALVDLAYVVLGMAHFYGLPWKELFAEVQRANMEKERATRKDQSLRGSTLDVVKPEGWRPPDIVNVLMRAGWPGPELPLEKE